MTKFLYRFWPLFFITAIWFLFAFPYVVNGKVPYASTYQVNFFAPWSHYEQFWGPVKNNAMPDVHTQIYPWKHFSIETFKSGQIPFWNPYNFSGNPHLANVQSSVLSPFNLLFAVLPFVDAWSIMILLQPLLAGFFMFIFLRALKISNVGSVIGATAFMFCGFNVVWMAYGTLAFAIVYLPLALFAIEKYSQSKRLKYLVLLALTIPLSFFSGHFQISFYFFLTIVAYVLFKGFIMRKSFIIHHSSFFILLGLVFSLPQLLPSIELYRQAVRSELFQISEAIPLQYLITIIAPDFFGNPVTRNDWFGHYAEWAGFVGIWPLVLAIYAVMKRNTTIVFFAIIGILSLLFAINSPLSSLLVSLKIPVISTSALSRVIVLFSFSFAALSGFGFDQLMKDVDKKTLRNIVIVFAAGAIFLAAIWTLVLFSKVYPPEWIVVAKRNFVLPTVLFLVGAFIILAATKQKKFMVLAAGYLLLATSFDSFRFAQKWMPFDPREFVYPETPIVDAIKAHIGQGRYYGNLGTEVSTYYGFPSIEGYDPLYIRRYGEFIRGAGEGRVLPAERSVAKLDRNGLYTDRVLDLLGVTLVFHPIADTNQGWAFPVWKDAIRYKLVYQDEKFQLYENTKALPRAALFYDYDVIDDDYDILARFYSNNFDFRKKIILEEDPLIAKIEEATGSAAIVSYTPTKISVKTVSSRPALLFLSDNFYTGWQAFVNGNKEHIYRADYTFRAVKIPQGDATVEFVYRPTFTL